jgi:ABC-2 type transport system ATP-binding protein
VVRREADGALAVSALSAPDIGDLAGTNGIFLHELATQSASLEEAFMELTRDSVEFHAEAFPLHEPVPAAGSLRAEET